MAYTNTEDTNGRQVQPIVLNESEDGTGTWHIITCDTTGAVIVTTN